MLPEHMIPGTVAHAVLGLSQTAGQATFPNGGPVGVDYSQFHLPRFDVRFCVTAAGPGAWAKVVSLKCLSCGQRVDDVRRYTAAPWAASWALLLLRFQRSAAAHSCDDPRDASRCR